MYGDPRLKQSRPSNLVSPWGKSLQVQCSWHLSNMEGMLIPKAVEGGVCRTCLKQYLSGEGSNLPILLGSIVLF